MKVLALCSYPVEAAATRHRISQFVEPLRERGIDLQVRPFLTSDAFKSFYSGGTGFGKLKEVARGVVHRLGDVLRAGDYDAVFVQREAMFFGPEIFEFMLNGVRKLPMVLDLDDATYVAYDSPVYGKLGRLLKFFGKTDRLIRRSATVVCGNRFIAEHVEALGGHSVVLPTTVNSSIFSPKPTKTTKPVLGWIGTHSTFPFLQSIFPVLSELATKHDFSVRIIGSGRDNIDIPGVSVESLPWRLEREPSDFASLDIGLYPISVSSSASDDWLKGKSGFKAIQYLAVGIPFVMTPFGVCAEIGSPGATHLTASSHEEWLTALDALISNPARRESMGIEGRKEFLVSFHPKRNADKLAEIFERLGRN